MVAPGKQVASNPEANSRPILGCAHPICIYGNHLWKPKKMLVKTQSTIKRTCTQTDPHMSICPAQHHGLSDPKTT